MNEHQAREEIVAYGALLWERRLITGTSGNVSVRLADGDIVVTPAARSLRNLSPGELVRVAPDGTPRQPHAAPTSELPLHLAAYGARADIGCVVHTHPTYCVAWSLVGRCFPQDTVGARETLGPVAWTPYHPAGSLELGAITAAEFERGIDVVIMERHGLSAIGATLERAFVLSDLAEEAARVAYLAEALRKSEQENTRANGT